MDLKRRLFPIAIALALVAMVFISWTPNWESAEFLRSTKPYVAFDYRFESEQTQVLQDVADDINNRLDVRHEWHNVGADEAQYDVLIQLQQTEQSIQLEASINKNDKAFDHVIVRGQAEVKHELSERLVKLLTDSIETEHQAENSSQN